MPFATATATDQTTLQNEVNTAAATPGGGTVELLNDIALISGYLSIPAGEWVTLTGNFKLIGVDATDTITVQNGGHLELDGITVTHFTGVTVDSHGVSVLAGGELLLTNGVITGDYANWGAGVANAGTFTMTGGEITGNIAGSKHHCLC